MQCIICGSSQWKYLFNARDRMFDIAGVFREYQCTHCRFVRLDPQPKGEGLAKYYPSKEYYSYSSDDIPGIFGRMRKYLISHLYRPTILSKIIELIAKVPAMPTGLKPGKILDIGCGSGDTIAQLKSIGWDVYGLDIDENAISVAHKRGLKNVSLGGYKEISKYPDNSFDVVRMYHVIEHLDNPTQCLKLIYRKLKPGGEVIIGTPNASSVVARIFRTYWYNLDCPRHLYLYSHKTLNTIVSQNGYKQLKLAFCSAGGWIGSIQYVLEDVLLRDIDLINIPWLVMLFYPIEWILDKLRVGDIIELRATK